MLKKIFCAAFLCAAIIFVGDAKVFAQDVWLFTDTRTGTEYYVMTETLKNQTPYRGVLWFEGYVKYVRGNSLITKKKFNTYQGEASFGYSINDSEIIYFSLPKTTELEVAFKLRDYCRKYFNIPRDWFRMSG